VEHHGVKIISPLHISSDLAYHASQMYAKNIAALVALIAPDGTLKLDMNDDIIAAVCVTSDGEVRNAAIRQKLSEATA
jgi:NAD(P) transhydrogenase subunit alpha